MLYRPGRKSIKTKEILLLQLTWDHLTICGPLVKHNKKAELGKKCIVLQNFVFLSFWPVTKMEDA